MPNRNGLTTAARLGKRQRQAGCAGLGLHEGLRAERCDHLVRHAGVRAQSAWQPCRAEAGAWSVPRHRHGKYDPAGKRPPTLAVVAAPGGPPDARNLIAANACTACHGSTARSWARPSARSRAKYQGRARCRDPTSCARFARAGRGRGARCRCRRRPRSRTRTPGRSLQWILAGARVAIAHDGIIRNARFGRRT